MTGALLGLISAAAFGANAIITRRAMLRVSSNYIATLSIFAGTLFFFLIVIISGKIANLDQVPWKALLFWILAGVVHFALGRTWAYKSIQYIGSNRSNVVTSLNPVATIILALVVLQETVTPLMWAGILFSLAGPLVMMVKEETLRHEPPGKTAVPGKEVDRATLYKGMVYGVGGAIFWGSSAIFIKLALREGGGSPVVGSFLSYLGATIVVGGSLFFNERSRTEVLTEDRRSLKWAVVSGVASGIAQLLRYVALGYASAIVVSLMNRTMPLWVLVLSFVFNREYESFSRWVLLGNLLLVIGTVLVLFS